MQIFVLALCALIEGTVVAQDAFVASKQACVEPKEPAEPVDDFNCGSRAGFPLREYEKDLSTDAKIKEIVASYGDIAETEKTVCPARTYVTTSNDAAVEKALVSKTSWLQLCPTWYYTIWRWGIYIRPYAMCYVLTPIRVTRCQRPNRACRYSPYFRTRCRQLYRRANILVYCPRALQRFVWISRWIPSCCDCQRLVCTLETTVRS